VTRLHELELLYATRRTSLVRLAWAICGDSERAADAVQDAFVACVRARDSFRGEGPLEAWVARAVVNAARKTRGRRRPLLAPVEVADGPSSVDPRIAPAVAALPERQRLVVFLRYYVDLDYRAIATVLGIEVGTVSATLAAAHGSLRVALEEVDAR
jgi:RNA polymerase sigma-70 factor (ECF subfamily)